ncbi:C-type mannose receptor 2-like [Oryzias latipes]|uniref:C-type mannose receptor 2-like n=1 Tax=Oryzias latipes TaxID=8090 RepID=UPI000CE16FBB|nr:C-type mannose receptor 2-like [Oryzias latipes]XP_020555376.2 C-type mannose receptor 2-like [Oryzias latipes]
MKLSLFLFILVGPCCIMTNQLLQYHFINENKSWDQARLYCKDNNHTDLATVISMADMNRLRQHLGNRSAWIGLYREANGSTMWQWSQPDVQFNESRDNGWDTDEPNDNGIENCGTLNTNKKWADLSCNRAKPFICYDEKTPSHVIYANESLNWTDAQSFCRDRHTDLISGPEQMKKLDGGKTKELIQQSEGGFVFIGLFRDAWQWSDGSSFSFRFWNLQYDDEKNDSSCAMMNEGGRWSSENCSEEHPFICYDDHVILIKESRTWEEALYYCRHHHHDLVTITNMDEQRWVQEKTKKASSAFVWTGLRYTCTLGFWFWVSDEVVHYKNWASPGQVNECDMSGAMETGGEHKWFKRNDEEKFNFFCSTS